MRVAEVRALGLALVAFLGGLESWVRSRTTGRQLALGFGMSVFVGGRLCFEQCLFQEQEKQKKVHGGDKRTLENHAKRG